ncbi:electron transfer flavoprotein subunit beta [Platysternon megacephalum]|uniref:Electron transfer flavoprotein subunit beta n=1 Tax=Platysternon megacephalum TaxID=55544 RepID=A0A4D9DDD2_9SAUR|nr:electron transfer flavoprotein subunit beta [Platysternon megacephalum]
MDTWVGNPDTEHDWLMARSPISYVDHITAPLFVVQGANDPRVVKAESDQIVASIRARGGDVRYDVYDDEGHGFAKEHNLVTCNQDVVDYLTSKLAATAPQFANT